MKTVGEYDLRLYLFRLLSWIRRYWLVVAIPFDGEVLKG